MRNAPTILLRSSWQTANIGDIAHTPGVLRLLEHHLPEARVVLWPGKLDRGVEALLRRRFPKLRIVRETPQWKVADPRPDDPTLEEAFEEASLLLHGSGPSLVAQSDVERWRDATGKPYGAYGVTLGSDIGATDNRPNFPDKLRRLLDSATFLFTRETASLDALRRAGIACPEVGFAPDGTFAIDLRDDASADRLMEQYGLEPERFLCVVPRLRLTPYWQIHPEWNMSEGEIARRQAVNEEYAERDHAKLREVITAWVRETGLPVLLCPEMTYQVEIFRPLVYDRLPDAIKPSVFPMERYWLTDEAASVYRRARAIVSMECHSPITAIANGRPAFYLRQPQDTWKGRMYPDLGLGDWAFELETATGAEIAARLLDGHSGYAAAVAKATEAAQTAADYGARAMEAVKQITEEAVAKR